ncbi:MAG: hypothetical protein J2P28_11845 [Actinobacteria bacterium]|nr:hypothetical protein [Actinomycetota bacterium]
MKGQRVPRAVGTYGPLDVARSGRRLPPDPQESLVDVAAVQHGESRVVVCFLSRRPSRWSPGPRIGVLEIRPGGATWRPWPSLGRRPCSLGVTAVLVVQPAARADIRLTGPGNFHLFTVVRCATAAGRIDLIVPTADVPLVTWRLAGEQAMQSDLARAARRPPPPPGRIDAAGTRRGRRGRGRVVTGLLRPAVLGGCGICVKRPAAWIRTNRAPETAARPTRITFLAEGRATATRTIAVSHRIRRRDPGVGPGRPYTAFEIAAGSGI